ncbi:hypothetical protein OE88DRAFT_1663931 [Heliocybe sulcata]|uniref:Uncharacterized protein n=1 Tax=Heliocybe sulcata TaxID=5364 RepID=A0A5C3MX88_9AGAM|nr:hypothetical protein OE88DRAFT_1663931 [Heliocybe sulcata]
MSSSALWNLFPALSLIPSSIVLALPNANSTTSWNAQQWSTEPSDPRYPIVAIICGAVVFGALFFAIILGTGLSHCLDKRNHTASGGNTTTNVVGNTNNEEGRSTAVELAALPRHDSEPRPPGSPPPSPRYDGVRLPSYCKDDDTQDLPSYTEEADIADGLSVGEGVSTFEGSFAGTSSAASIAPPGLPGGHMNP